jgi:hypothetical protein
MSFLFVGARLHVDGTDGSPLAGGWVYTYEAGTVIPKVCYSDAAATVPKANPFQLDAYGEADVWLVGNYKILIKDANLVTLPGYPVDYIPGNVVSSNDLASDAGAGMVGTESGETVQEVLDGIIANAKKVPKRQGALAGPHNSLGAANLGGSTGSTIVTTTGIAPGVNRLVVTAGGGFNEDGALDYVGYTDANLVFSGLSTNGTMYLYVDITPGTGVLTAGASTLAPVYGNGVPSTTTGQFTYVLSEGIAYVGNGGTAAPAPRVYLGQVSVAGGVVTGVQWYSYITSPQFMDMNPFRAFTTPYVNNSSQDLFLEVSIDLPLGGIIDLIKQGAVVAQRVANNNASPTWVCISSIITPGQTYQVSAGGAYTFLWRETR